MHALLQQHQSHQLHKSCPLFRKGPIGHAGPRLSVRAATSAQQNTSEESPEPKSQLKPAYKKYLDAAGLARHDYREWQELSADGVEIPPPTLFTKLIYPLQFVKYNFVPEILRYVWYHVWIRLVAAYGPYHKKLVLEGAKLDAYLQHEGSPEESLHINRRHALLRYHWKMGPLQNIGVRLSLLRAAVPKMIFRWRRKNLQQAEDSNLAAPKVLL